MPSDKYNAKPSDPCLAPRPSSLLDPPSPRRRIMPSPVTPISYGEWTRETSTWDIFFRLQLPYRAPRSKFAAFLWRRRLWIETTFALTMMEPWEKVVAMCVFWLLMAPFVTGAYVYFPQHVRYVCGRTRCYLSGRELDVPAALKWSASYFNTWGNATRAVGIGGEL